MRLDDRIRLFGMTNDNASSLSSASDIALGAFRYCLNTAAGEGREDVARQMFPDLATIMWGQLDAQGDPKISGRGFNPYPLLGNIRVDSYRERYKALSDALDRYSLGPIEQNLDG